MLKPRCSFLVLLCIIAASSKISADESTDRWLRYFEGNWQRKTTVDDGENVTTANISWTAKFSAGQHCLVFNNIDSEGITTTGVGSAGVDGKGYCEQGIESTGVYFTVRFPNAAGEEMKGELEAFVPDHEGTGKGTISIRRTGEDSYVTNWNVKWPDGSVMKGVEENTRVSRDKSSTPEEFQQLSDRLTGRWLGAITMIDDWPGQDAGRGDKVISYCEFSQALDDQVIKCRESLGKHNSEMFIAWNPVTRQIEITIAGTNGGMHRGVMWKENDNAFGWRLVGGGTIEGKALRGTGTWVFSEADSVLTMQGDATLDGKELLPYKDVYRRLSPKGSK